MRSHIKEKSVDLNRFEIIKQANQVSDLIWEEVAHWQHFPKDTIGKQLVRAADSISANLSEAYGRFSFAERKRFSYYARGSLCETTNWMEKSISRGYFAPEKGNKILIQLQNLSCRINSYIHSLS